MSVRSPGGIGRHSQTRATTTPRPSFAQDGARNSTTVRGMNTETVAAVAAVAAAVVSALNIAATRRLAQSMESTKWTRQLMPDLVRELEQARHHQYMAYFDADWGSCSDDEASDLGMKEFRRGSEAQERLEVFASPTTIMAAREVSYELEAMRFYFLDHREAAQSAHANSRPHEDRGKWHHYWRYAESSQAFLNAARKEMGLQPVPIPPGLADMRKKITGSESKSILHRGKRGSN